jgi:hypothetical protein
METECPKCEAPMEWRIFEDGDGDPSVPGGSRSWTDAECIKTNCACELTEEEYDALRFKVIEAAQDWVPTWMDY